MSLFNLGSRVFETTTVAEDVSDFFPFSDITYDTTQVKELLYAAVNDDTIDFAVFYDYGGWVLGTSIESLGQPFKKFVISLYFEYVDMNGYRQNTIEDFVVYGYEHGENEPRIMYIENIASRVDTTEEVILHCENLNEDISVFLHSYSGLEQSCIKIPDEDVGIDVEKGIVRFVITPGMLGTTENGGDRCGVYDINLGFGECGSSFLFENNPDTNLGIIRYKYSSDNDVDTTTSGISSEGNCWFASDFELIDDSNDMANPTDTSSATDGYGKNMYVRTGLDASCPCYGIKYYRVRLKYNTRLDRRYGELVLNGVQLRSGDIVWLAAQFDGTDGLWVVDEGDWYGLDTYEGGDSGSTSGSTSSEQEPSATTGTVNPCTGVQVPKAVDCSVFVDLGAKVNDKVKYTCSSDVPVKYGSQTVCSHVVRPGDIVALTNQSDGGNGLWQVTCTEWVFLGQFDAIDGTSIDATSAIIVQNDIDFCKCGGIFHIDYYYLNSSCYLNHIRRTVKVLCAGASIAPNSERQYNITDYSISTGEEDSLVNSKTGTPGDPEKETCMENVASYDYQYRLSSTEHAVGCTGDTIVAPNCQTICNCPKYYNIGTTDDYSGSKDANGFSIVFWQKDASGWHLYAYVGEGKYDTGMTYYVYHLKTAGWATADRIDVNSDQAWYEKDSAGRLVESRTHDCWFVEHDGKLADGFGLVDDTWQFAVKDADGERIPNSFTRILSENNMDQRWSIGCTTTFLAHRTYEDVDDDETTGIALRTTCADMLDAEKCDYASTQLIGMENIYGFKYYKSVISKGEFVDLYNSYSCN